LDLPLTPPAGREAAGGRVETITVAGARAHFADPEAELMPDFEIPAR
jgi:hypothetical protein